MLDNCQLFRDLATLTWEFTRNAHLLKTPLNEETITEVLLYHLAKYATHTFKATAFTKAVETINGADYEFLFIGQKILRIRIQAKRLFLRSNKYESMYKTVNQVNLLINGCKVKNQEAVPAYCFYNSNISMSVPPNEKLLGCSIADAYDVLKSIQPVDNSQKTNYMLRSFPWHALVCPPETTVPKVSVDAASIAYDALMDSPYFDKGTLRQHLDNAHQDYKNSPKYVKDLYDNGQTDEAIPVNTFIMIRF